MRDIKRHIRNIRKILALGRMLGVKQTLGLALSRYAHKGAAITLTLKGIPSPVFIRPKGHDINVLWQIFGARSCHIDLQPPPEVIIDGGAHVGFASIYFANLYPKAKIIAIEPEPSNFALAKMNLRSYPQCQVIPCALWSRDARLVIENPQAQSWSFRFRATSVPSESEAAFLGRSLDSLIRELRLGGADLVKLDIEGAESEVFCSEEIEWLSKAKALIIEIHETGARSAIESVLQPRGFRHTRQEEKHVYIRGDLPGR